jgi:DNA-binding cell septation regulator SpoVG
MDIVNPNKQFFNQQDTKAKHSRVEVLDIRAADHGSVRAYARVKVGAFAIAGVKVIQQDGQRPWVRLPDQQGNDGRWFPIVTCSSPTLENAIAEVVLAAWRELQP